MDHVLEKVVGENRISMIDEFSGYKEIVVHENDREKMCLLLYGEPLCRTKSLLV